MIYVMSDIHGNSENFNCIMDQINLQPEDTLYVLGDVIDRYPGGIDILLRLMKMPNVKMLLGNHEYMLLDVLGRTYDMSDPEDEERYDRRRYRWYHNGGGITHHEFLKLSEEIQHSILEYLKSLPHNLDSEVGGVRYKLAHAAPEELYSIKERGYKDGRHFSVWYRIKKNTPIPQDYTLIFGHTPTSIFQTREVLKIWHWQNLIDIDCGSGFPNPNDNLFYKFNEIGRLSCLRLDDMKEFYSMGNKRAQCPDCSHGLEYQTTWDGYLMLQCPKCLSTWRALNSETGETEIVERYFFG